MNIPLSIAEDFCGRAVWQHHNHFRLLRLRLFQEPFDYYCLPCICFFLLSDSVHYVMVNIIIIIVLMAFFPCLLHPQNGYRRTKNSPRCCGAMAAIRKDTLSVRRWSGTRSHTSLETWQDQREFTSAVPDITLNGERKDRVGEY